MITLKAESFDDLTSALKRLGDPARRKDLLEQIGAAGVMQTQQRFLDQAGPDGQPWVQSRRAKEQSGETLRDTNRLFTSLTYAADDKSVEWGTNVIYAGIHQFGGVIKPKSKKALSFKGANGKTYTVKSVTIPARPYLGLTDQNRNAMRDVVHDWMKGAWAK